MSFLRRLLPRRKLRRVIVLRVKRDPEGDIIEGYTDPDSDIDIGTGDPLAPDMIARHILRVHPHLAFRHLVLHRDLIQECVPCYVEHTRIMDEAEPEARQHETVH